jgi:hypothetical protein
VGRVRFEFLMIESTKITVVWDMIEYSLADRYISISKRKQVPPKHSYQCTKLHGGTSQKIII